MEVMYWVTRLDAIDTMFTILMVFSVFGIIGFIATKICSITCYCEDDRNICQRISKGFRCCLVIFPISMLGLVFTPTTNDALVIFGVGGTIDWVKNNDNVKQIPDKAVEALSLYLDNINEEQRDKDNKKNRSEHNRLED